MHHQEGNFHHHDIRAVHWSRDTVQSAEAKHVIPTAAVATMVLPNKRTVKDITQGPQLEPWTRTSRSTSH